MSERTFIQRCLRRERGVWDEFIKRYSRLIYGCIHSTLKIKGLSFVSSTVDDLFQEIFLSLLKDNFKKPKLNRKFILSLLVLVVIGVIDEAIQYFLPFRVFDLRDIVMNTVSSLGGIALFYIVRC